MLPAWRYRASHKALFHPIQDAWKHGSQIPAETPLSNKISRDLKQRGFNFVGPTIIYAHMQATGMVKDHTTDCFRYAEVYCQKSAFRETCF